MELNEILKSLKSGKISITKAEKLLSLYSIEQIEEYAKIDVNRKKRRGIPEVIYSENKSFYELKKIVTKILKKSNSVLLSRIKNEDYEKMKRFAKKSNLKISVGKNSTALLIYKKPITKSNGCIGIVTAGTSDIRIAEEARLMCKAMNCKTISSYDIGIAGLQRVFPAIKKMIKNDVDAIIVVAGMEGALASVISSLVNIPVIGVPASVGYGYGKNGVAALASMLQNCTLGMSVVNIDGGIAAGAVAAIIARRTRKKHQ